MSEIIRIWLQNRLGLLFEDQSWEQDRGGGVLAQLLNSYTLITEDQTRTIQAQKGDNYEPTLEVMRLAITRLGINLNKHEFREVLDAKGTAVSKLFYELFLVLQDKNTTDIILARKLRGPIIASRFSVTTQDENTEVSEEIEVEKFNNPLAISLADKQDVVSYHINKHLKLMETCKKAREDYLNFFAAKRKQEANIRKTASLAEVTNSVAELPVDAESLNQSAGDLMKESKSASRMRCITPDEQVSKQIISAIQQNARKVNKNRTLRETFRREILKNLWDKLLKEQEDYFRHEFVDKLQQQSLYEQQMTTCLLQVREKRHEIAEQKKEMLDIINKQQEDAMIAKLFDEEHHKDQERYEYYAELDKKMATHRKLRETKLKRANAEKTQEVDDIMRDIIDIALYNIDYKENHCEELPRRKRDDLARLFIAKQPIFDILENVTEVIAQDNEVKRENDSTTSSTFTEEENNDIEPITLAELDRQNVLDDLTFDDYHNFKWPWDYSSWMQFPEGQELNLGLNVIGHIVHRLLLGKYPRKVLPATPAVKKYNIAVCIDGLHKLEYLPALEQLLAPRKVKVVQIKDAFEYCLDAFKRESTEATADYCEVMLEDATATGLEVIDNKRKNKKEVVKKGAKSNTKSGKEDKKTTKGSESSKKSDTVTALIEQPAPSFEDKTNQTPKYFPDEDLQLSDAGNVGRSLFEVLNLGDTPNEHLNASAFVEYLKGFRADDIEGWVLVNYPQTIQQAIILEETLSCVRIPAELSAFPNDSLNDLVDLDETANRGFADASWETKRRSKLLPNPRCLLDDKLEYDTFLTAFVELRSRNNDDPDEAVYDCFRNQENMAALCQFYMDQGCKYTLYYDSMDFAAVKHLGKLILGDYSMPPKDSVALFTDTVHYVEANFDEMVEAARTEVEKQGEKVEKKKKRKEDKESGKTKLSGKTKETKATKKKEEKSSKDTKNKKKKAEKKEKSKKGKSQKSESQNLLPEMEDEETQIPTPIPEPEEPLEPPLPPPNPGEYRWIYHDLPIMTYYEDALATLWENIEEIYVTDMKQLFFRRRTIMDALTPYNTYVKNNLLEFIARPDDKQKHLSEFQLVYNEFEDDMREDDEVKCELHMRIEEFREKLWKICDARMLENEAERVRVVQENWITTQLIELCNIYTGLIQLEVDRSTDCSQMLCDYYTAMITGAPCGGAILEKLQLEIIPLPKTIEDLDHVAPFVEFTEDTMEQAKGKEVDTKTEHNPYKKKMNLLLKSAGNTLDDNLKRCEGIKTNLQLKFRPKDAKKDKKTVEPEQDAKQHAQELLEEFHTAYKAEFLRCDLRLKILNHAFDEELEDLLDKSSGSFGAMFKYIEERYKKEIHAVEQAARLLKRAVEEETSIQPELLLENAMFYVKLGSLMYESPLPDDDDVPVREISDDEVFTISQLDRILDVLVKLAPGGIIPTKAFMFLVQEFLVYRGEDGSEDFVPKIWQRLEPYKVERLFEELFGPTEYVDWKDFIVYSLALRFPTEREVLEMRRSFRSLDPDMCEFIERHQYSQVKFWFEVDGCSIQQPRLKYLRDLIYRLFSIDGPHGRLNYTALLLAFCKDEDPLLGLVKALEVSLGKLVIHDEEKGAREYTKDLRKVMERELSDITRNKERADMEYFTKDVIEKLVDEAVHRTDSVVINEFDNDNAAPLCTYDIIQYLNDTKAPRLSQCNQGEGVVLPDGVTDYEDSGEDFTNSGSQEHIAKDPVIYQVDFDVIMNIFTVMIPWLQKMKSYGELMFHERFAMLYNSLINEDVRVAYLYQILRHEDFLRIFQVLYKFSEKRIVEIVRNLLDSD